LANAIETLIQAEEATPSDLLCTASALLCLLFARFLNIQQSRDPFWSTLVTHTYSAKDQNPDRFILDIRKKVEHGLTIEQFLHWFLDSYIVAQADQVFKERINVSSLSIPASWITIEGKTIRKQRDYDASLSSSRFHSSYQILTDLSLCKFNGAFTELSTDGRRLLESLGIELTE
jgi:predicted transposase YbfD/YdcC